MRNCFFIFICLSFAFSTQAQSVFKHHKFRIGISASPVYAYRTLRAPDSFQAAINNLNKIDKAKFGYSAGIRFIADVHKRISIETGALFSDQGYRNELPVTSAMGGVNIGTSTINYKYNYLNIPLKFNLYLVNRKVRLFVSGGLQSGIFLFEQQKVKTEFNDGRTVKEKFNAVTQNTHLLLSAVAGVGLDFYLIKRLCIRFEPIFSYGFYNSQDQSIDYLPYEVGANVGVFLGFK